MRVWGQSQHALSCHCRVQIVLEMLHCAESALCPGCQYIYITINMTTAVYVLRYRSGLNSWIVSSNVSGLSATFIMSYLAFQRPTSFCSFFSDAPVVSVWCTEPRSDLEPLTVVCSFPAASGPWMAASSPSSSTNKGCQQEHFRGILVFHHCAGCSVELRILLPVPQRLSTMYSIPLDLHLL